MRSFLQRISYNALQITGCDGPVDYVSPDKTTYVLINGPDSANLPARKHFRVEFQATSSTENRGVRSIVEFYPT